MNETIVREVSRPAIEVPCDCPVDCGLEHWEPGPVEVTVRWFDR